MMKAIYLEWEDSASVTGWQWYDGSMVLHVVTIGFLVGEDGKSVTISSSYDANADPKFADIMSIPKSAIRKRRWLKV